MVFIENKNCCSISFAWHLKDSIGYNFVHFECFFLIFRRIVVVEQIVVVEWTVVVELQLDEYGSIPVSAKWPLALVVQQGYVLLRRGIPKRRQHMTIELVDLLVRRKMLIPVRLVRQYHFLLEQYRCWFQCPSCMNRRQHLVTKIASFQRGRKKYINDTNCTEIIKSHAVHTFLRTRASAW